MAGPRFTAAKAASSADCMGVISIVCGTDLINGRGRNGGERKEDGGRKAQEDGRTFAHLIRINEYCIQWPTAYCAKELRRRPVIQFVQYCGSQPRVYMSDKCRHLCDMYTVLSHLFLCLESVASPKVLTTKHGDMILSFFERL